MSESKDLATTEPSQPQKLVAPPDPAAKPYFSYVEQRPGRPETWNYQSWPQGTRTIQIAAKSLVLDAADSNRVLARIESDPDVKRLDIYAETVVVRRPIHVPGAEVHIFAETLRFEDAGATPSVIDTTPRSPPPRAAPRVAGLDGQAGGDVYVAVKVFFSEQQRFPRFVLNGAPGQQGGAGSRGGDGAPRVPLAAAKPQLLACAHNISLPIPHNPVFPPSYNNPGLTFEEIRDRALDLGQEFPGDGEPGIPGGKAGKGGDAGSLHVIGTLNLGIYMEATGGPSAGGAGFFAGGNPGTPNPAVKLGTAKCEEFSWRREIGGAVVSEGRESALIVTGVEKRTLRPGAGATSPGASRSSGEVGVSSTEPGEFAWYHPHALAMTIAFAEDAFANDFHDLASSELTKQDALLQQLPRSDTWQALSADDRTLFTQDALRVRSLVDQLRSHEDYWGNPQGWVPALSLEANVALFQQEVGWAIRTIFVSDWLTDENNALKSKSAALAQAKSLLRVEIDQVQAQFDDAVARLPGLESDAGDAAGALAKLQIDLQATEQRLTARAIQNVQDRENLPFWKKALKVMFVAASAIPIGQPVTGGVAASLNALLDFDSEKPWDTLAKLPDVVGAFKSTDIAKKAQDAKDKISEQKPEDKKKKSELQEAIADIQKYLGPLVDALKKHKDEFKDKEVKKEERDKQIEAELAKLKDQDPHYKEIEASVKSVIENRDRLVKSIADTTSALEQAAAKISEHWLAVAELLPQIEGVEANIVSQRAEIALVDMRQQALRRLQKYQYLLARSYEYRMLHRYQGDLTLTNMFNEVRDLVRAADGTGVLQAAQFDRLYALFRNEISALVEEVVTEVSSGRHVVDTIGVNYRLSAAEIARLNAGAPVEFNFWERGAFRDNEEDVRIVGFEITELQVKQIGAGDFALVDLETQHEGTSRIWRDGKVSVFQHYNKHTLQPLHWATRWQDGTITQFQPSASADSLLRALIPNASTDIMLFSRPSAWGILSMRKRVHGTGVDFQIQSAKLHLTYDRTTRTSEQPWTQYRDGQNAIINTAYQSVLHRPADAAELTAARALLDVGYAVADVQGIVANTHNQEYFGVKVGDFYQQQYARPPVPVERDFWAEELMNKRPESQVHTYIRQITDVFNARFHRTPSYDELQTSTGRLDHGLTL